MLLLLAGFACTPDAPREDPPAATATDPTTPPDPCAEEWPDGEADAYVREGGDGDGSREAPFGALEDALEVGGIIALAPGTYTGAVRFTGRGRWELRGRCADRVRLRADDGDVITLAGNHNTEVVLAGLTVEGGPGEGVVVTGGVLSASDVVLEGGAGFTVEVLGGGADATLTGSVVRDTLEEEGQAVGIAAWSGASVVIRDTTMSGHASASVVVGGAGARATLETSTVEGGDYGVFAQDAGEATLVDTVVRTSGTAGAEAWRDGSVVVEGGRFEQAGFFPLLAVDGGSVEATDCLVDGTAEGVAAGALATGGGSVTLVGCTITHTEPSLVAADEGGVVHVTDSVLVDPLGALPAVTVQRGAVAHFEGVRLEGFHGVGLLVGEGTAEVVDTTFVAAAETPTECGPAIQSEFGDTTLSGVTLDRPWCVGVGAIGVGRLWLDDVAINDPRAWHEGAAGRGLEIQYDVVAEGNGVSIAGATGAGLLADHAASVTVSDLSVLGTRRSTEEWTAAGVVLQDAPAEILRAEVAGTEGPGVYLQGASTLGCTDCTVSDNQFAGFVVMGGALVLTDGVVRDNGRDASAGGGVGVFARSDGTPSG